MMNETITFGVTLHSFSFDPQRVVFNTSKLFLFPDALFRCKIFQGEVNFAFFQKTIASRSERLEHSQTERQLKGRTHTKKIPGKNHTHGNIS